MILILAAVATALVLGLNLGLLLAGGGGGIVEAGLFLALLSELAFIWMKHDAQAKFPRPLASPNLEAERLIRHWLDSERLTPQRRARLRAVRTAYEPPKDAA